MLASLRSLVYKMGFRPKPGTILFSPSMDLRLKAEAAIKNTDWFKLHAITENTRLVRVVMNECEVCGKPDKEKPTVFRGEKWCCENHRKIVINEQPKPRY